MTCKHHALRAAASRRYRQNHPEYRERERLRERRNYHSNPVYRQQMTARVERYLTTAKGLLNRVRNGAKGRVGAKEGEG